MKTAEPLKFKILDIVLGIMLGLAFIPVFLAEKVNGAIEHIAESYLDYRRSLKGEK